MPSVALAAEDVAADDDLAFQLMLDAREREIRRIADRDRKRPLRERLRSRAELISQACGTHPLTGDPYYTPEDVLGWIQRNVEAGCAMPQLGAQTIIDLLRCRIVPNARLRERYTALRERGEVTSAEVALGIDAVRTREGQVKPDVGRVATLLGLRPTHSSKGKDYLPQLRLFIPYETAVRFADALDIPYYEVGV